MLSGWCETVCGEQDRRGNSGEEWQVWSELLVLEGGIAKYLEVGWCAMVRNAVLWNGAVRVTYCLLMIGAPECNHGLVRVSTGQELGLVCFIPSLQGNQTLATFFFQNTNKSPSPKDIFFSGDLLRSNCQRYPWTSIECKNSIC